MACDGSLASCQGSLANETTLYDGELAAYASCEAQLTTQTNAIAVDITAIQNRLRVLFNDPTFTIPGATPLDQYNNLMTALIGQNTGRLNGLYKSLGGTH